MRVRLAQNFDVFSQFVPTKASIYLKRVGKNSSSAFDLSLGSVVIDATNFSSLDQATNKFVLADTTGYTGNGSLKTLQIGGSNSWAVANYPIRTNSPGKYTLSARVFVPAGGGTLSVTIDGIEVGSVTTASVSPAWVFQKVDFVLPDDNVYEFGVCLKENGASLDKLHISSTNPSDSGSGPDYSPSPFVTIHLQVYNAVDHNPTTPLDIYAYKTTLDEVVIDDWYNFEIRLLHGTNSFNGSYALVLSATGCQESNFVIWEMVDNDEYLILPSAIKVDNV